MRKILKFILQYLSIWSIKKHNIELVVVNGFTGVELVKEGIYEILSQKYICRRSTDPIWWDFSIPLNILGYKDKKRTVLEWVVLILKSIVYLLIGSQNQHILILSASSDDKSTSMYWQKFLKPRYLVIINGSFENELTQNLIHSTEKNEGSIIYDPEELENKIFKNQMTYGKNKEFDVNYSIDKNEIKINYKDIEYALPKEMLPEFVYKILVAIVAFATCKGITKEDIEIGLVKYDLRNNILKKISKNIGE